MLRRLISQIFIAILGLFLAIKFIPGTKFVGTWETFFFCGLILGLVNFFVKPVLKILTIPLRILTLGLFGLVINMGILWFIDVIFPELEITGVLPLFYTTCVIVILNLFFKPTKK